MSSNNSKGVKICSLVKVYKGHQNGEMVRAVDDISVDIRPGEFVTLLGPSGCGKTTTLRMVAGFEEITGGEIYIGDELVNHVPPDKRDTAMVFQSYALFPNYNIYDNIAIGGGDSNRIKELARHLEIERELWKLPDELSGGQRHRAALARTFAADTPLMILDEPFRGLDSALKYRIVDRLWQSETVGKTVILITHSAEDAERLADKVVEL